MAAAIQRGEDGAEADERFHGAIAKASRNPLLVSLMEQLAEPIDQSRRASLSRPARGPRSLHETILAAIERQDEDGAAQAMREHLKVVADVAFVPHEEPGPGTTTSVSAAHSPSAP